MALPSIGFSAIRRGSLTGPADPPKLDKYLEELVRLRDGPNDFSFEPRASSFLGDTGRQSVPYLDLAEQSGQEKRGLSARAHLDGP